MDNAESIDYCGRCTYTLVKSNCRRIRSGAVKHSKFDMPHTPHRQSLSHSPTRRTMIPLLSYYYHVAAVTLVKCPSAVRALLPSFRYKSSYFNNACVHTRVSTYYYYYYYYIDVHNQVLTL